jgi:hypothetical protein
MIVRLAIGLVVPAVIIGVVARIAITAGLSDHLNIDNSGSAVLGGFLIALFSWLAELLLPAARRGKHPHRAPAHHTRPEVRDLSHMSWWCRWAGRPGNGVGGTSAPQDGVEGPRTPGRAS